MPLPVNKKRKTCLSSHRCHFVKKCFFTIKFLHANVQWVYRVKAQYEIVQSKTVVGVDRPVNALPVNKKKKNCLSTHRCHFVKNYFFRNKISSCKCPMGVHHVGTI